MEDELDADELADLQVRWPSFTIHHPHPRNREEEKRERRESSQPASRPAIHPAK